MRASVCIDGLLCDTHIMLDAAGFPNKPHNVGVSATRTSDYTRRDFVFAALKVSGICASTVEQKKIRLTDSLEMMTDFSTALTIHSTWVSSKYICIGSRLTRSNLEYRNIDLGNKCLRHKSCMNGQKRLAPTTFSASNFAQNCGTSLSLWKYNRFGKEYASPAPVIDMVQYEDIDSKPYLTFEFKYKPLGLFLPRPVLGGALTAA